MGTIVSYSIGSDPVSVHLEYTSPEVVDEFASALSAFVDLYNLQDENADPDINTIADLLNDSVIADATAASLEEGLIDLLTLSQGLGRPRLGDPGPAVGDYLSMEMATAVDQLIKSLQAVGVNTDVIVSNVNALQYQPQGVIGRGDVRAWKDFSTTSSSIKNILTLAVRASAGTIDGVEGGTSNTSLQALVELVYVRTGNELISETLEGLEDALSITKDALALLNDIQALHNLVAPVESETFLEAALRITGKTNVFDQNDPLSLLSIWTLDEYKAITSELYNNPITITLSSAAFKKSTNSAGQTVVVKGVLSDDVAERYNSVIEQLDRQIFLLSPESITPRLENGSEDPQSLLAKLKLIRSQFTDADINNHEAGENFTYADLWTNSRTSLWPNILDEHVAVADEIDNFYAAGGVSVWNAGDPTPAEVTAITDAIKEIGNMTAIIEDTNEIITSSRFGGLDPISDQQTFDPDNNLTAIFDIETTFTPEGLVLTATLKSSFEDYINKKVEEFSGLLSRSDEEVFTYYNFAVWAGDGNDQPTSVDGGAEITAFNPNEVQQAITNAITAGENLNDTQKDKVRQFMFVFEEYYKSASAILTKITQIIQRMAQGIAR